MSAISSSIYNSKCLKYFLVIKNIKLAKFYINSSQIVKVRIVNLFRQPIVMVIYHFDGISPCGLCVPTLNLRTWAATSMNFNILAR